MLTAKVIVRRCLMGSLVQQLIADPVAEAAARRDAAASGHGAHIMMVPAMAAAIGRQASSLAPASPLARTPMAAWPPDDEETMKTRPAHKPPGLQQAIPFRAETGGLRV